MLFSTFCSLENIFFCFCIYFFNVICFCVAGNCYKGRTCKMFIWCAVWLDCVKSQPRPPRQTAQQWTSGRLPPCPALHPVWSASPLHTGKFRSSCCRHYCDIIGSFITLIFLVSCCLHRYVFHMCPIIKAFILDACDGPCRLQCTCCSYEHFPLYMQLIQLWDYMRDSWKVLSNTKNPFQKKKIILMSSHLFR